MTLKITLANKANGYRPTCEPVVDIPESRQEGSHERE